MSVYHKFEPDDISNSSLLARSFNIFASSSSGWTGSTGPTGSLSIYADVRSRKDVFGSNISTSGLAIYPALHSTQHVVRPSGSYPLTASLEFVKVRTSEAPSSAAITHQDWYAEHWRPLELLYGSYYTFDPSRFITGSYDRYMIYLSQNASNQARAVHYSGSSLSELTSSMTTQAWVKLLSSSTYNDRTLFSQRERWRVFMTGSTPRPAFSDFASTVTASFTIATGSWCHVSVVVGEDLVKFYADGSLLSSGTYTGSLLPYAANFVTTSSFLTIGAQYLSITGSATRMTIFGNEALSYGAVQEFGGVASFFSMDNGVTIVYGEFDSDGVGNFPGGGGNNTSIRVNVSGSGTRDDVLYLVKNFAYSSSLAWSGSLDTGSHVVTFTSPVTGSGIVLTAIFDTSKIFLTSQIEGTNAFEKYTNSLRGFAFETRIFSSSLSAARISGTWSKSLEGSSSSLDLIHYSRFNDGPLSTRHGFSMGSGSYEFGRSSVHGQFTNFTIVSGPNWQPNDEPTSLTSKLIAEGTPSVFRILHVPSLYYGRQIETGSFSMTCPLYQDLGIVRTIVDDGKGGLYLSGSISRPIASDQDYRGQRWNKVGNIFYSEGFAVITEPSLLDISYSGSTGVQFSFAGLSKIPTKTFSCRLPSGQANASNNPTFSYVDSRGTPETDDDNVVVKGADNTTYITALGFYDRRGRLVAVAKLAQAIRKRERDNLTFRIRYDF